MKVFRLTALALACALTGCASVAPTPFTKEAAATETAVADKMSQEWNAPPSLKEGKQSTVLLTPLAVPREIRSKPVSLELEAGANITDVVAALARLGHSVILADKDAGAKSFYLPRYEGNIGGLLSNIARVTDVWFTWHDGTIVVSSKERIAISFPQDEGLAKQLAGEVKAFGIEGASVSGNAGMLSMEVTPSQLRKVKQYLERSTANAAIVTLQLAIVNVSLKQDAKQGIDWEGLSFAVGSRARTAINDPLYKSGIDVANAYNPSTTTGSTGSTTTGGTTGGTSTGSTTDNAVKLIDAASGLLTKSGALNGVIATGNFAFGAMFNFLEKYGSAETRQNTVFKTITGQEVTFKSLTEVPYVSELGAVASTNTTSSSVKTDKAKDGLELTMTPTFDASANTVSVKLKMSLKAVIAFNELSAGNQVGKLSQPTTADRSFNDEIRLRPGQTAVIGGIVYDSIADNRALPLFLQKGSSLESQALKVDRQAMFIVIRPAVTRLGDFGESEAESLDFLPNGVLPAEPVKKAPAKPVAKAPKKALPAEQPESVAKPAQPPVKAELAVKVEPPKKAEGSSEYQEIDLQEGGK